jgi:hypothetical protein
MLRNKKKIQTKLKFPIVRHVSRRYETVPKTYHPIIGQLFRRKRLKKLEKAYGINSHALLHYLALITGSRVDLKDLEKCEVVPVYGNYYEENESEILAEPDEVYERIMRGGLVWQKEVSQKKIPREYQEVICHHFSSDIVKVKAAKQGLNTQKVMKYLFYLNKNGSTLEDYQLACAVPQCEKREKDLSLDLMDITPPLYECDEYKLGNEGENWGGEL